MLFFNIGYARARTLTQQEEYAEAYIKCAKPTRTIPFNHTFFLSSPLLPPYTITIVDARSCLTCDKVLAELEKIDDDTDSFGVDFVKINDKRLAKQYGIKNFPALTYFRYNKHPKSHLHNETINQSSNDPFIFLHICQRPVPSTHKHTIAQGEGTDHLRG